MPNTVNRNLARTEYSRVFIQAGGSGPANQPIYEGLWRAGAPTWSFGDVTTTRIQSDSQYGQFDVADKIVGDPGDPQLTITAKMTMNRSRLLQLARNGCDNTLHVHFGKCANPQDFNGGFELKMILEDARPTQWSSDELGALTSDQRADINEEVPFTGLDMYQIGKIAFGRNAEAYISREVIGVHVCDSVVCGACGRSSDGCQVVLAVVLPSTGSAGLAPEIVYTEDGGSTWNEMPISTMGAAGIPSGVTCVGNYVVVTEPAGNSVHYILLSDLLDGVNSWVELTDGFTTAKGPNAIYSASPTETFIVGLGGYIYKMSDATSAVVAQSEGAATAQNLNDVFAIDGQRAVAVGASNAVVFTLNGGQVWSSVTGPAVGVALTSVLMRSETEWFVGTAGGKLYYTTNSGRTWVEKAFSGSGTGTVHDIVAATKSVLYMAHSTASAGRIFRSTDGGYSWVLIPGATEGTLPANDRIVSLAVCEDPNTVFGGGLGDDASDGILVKGSSSVV